MEYMDVGFRLWSESEMKWIENEVKRGNLKMKGRLTSRESFSGKNRTAPPCLMI